MPEMNSPGCATTALFQTELEHELQLAERGGFTVSLARLELTTSSSTTTKTDARRGPGPAQLARILEDNIGVLRLAIRGREAFILHFLSRRRKWLTAAAVAQAIAMLPCLMAMPSFRLVDRQHWHRHLPSRWKIRRSAPR